MEPEFGIVAMLDALGVSNYSIEDAKRFISQKDALLKELMEVEAPKIASLFEKITIVEGIKSEFPEIKIAVFGDTIIICWPISLDARISRERRIWAVFPGVAVWLQRAVALGIKLGILLRGSVSIGEYLHDGNTLLGPAITDAHVWSQEADWFGVILTPHCRIYLTALLENEAKKKAIQVNDDLFCVKYF